MSAYVGLFCTATDVNDKTISTATSRAGWVADDISNIAIQEADIYLEGRLIRLGYTRSQLVSATQLKILAILYSKYVVLRDIFTQNSPSHSPAEPYEKWLDIVKEKLADIESNTLRLSDSLGQLITPATGDPRYKVEITTDQVKRAISMDESSKWKIDGKTYADESVIGQK
jgi:hypothetical protein